MYNTPEWRTQINPDMVSSHFAESNFAEFQGLHRMANVQIRLTNSQRYLVVGLVELGYCLLLPLWLVGLVLWLV